MSAYEYLRALWRGLPLGFRRAVRRRPWIRKPISRLHDRLLRNTPHDTVYDRTWYEARHRAFDEGQQAMADTFYAQFAPESVIDVGCGTGSLLSRFQELGARVFGLERSEAALAICSERGLNVETIDLSCVSEEDADRYRPPYALVLCLEVAEHLPPESAKHLVDFLGRLGSRVVFSAARPGQGGLDHLNEQLPEYWIDLFDSAGFSLDRVSTEYLKSEWANNEKVAIWFKQNTLVFWRENRSP